MATTEEIRADLEGLLKDAAVLAVTHDHDLAPRDALADQPGGLDAVAPGEVGVEHGDAGRRPLGVGDRLEAVAGLRDDLEVVLALEREADRLTEQRLLVGEQDPNPFDVFRQPVSPRYEESRRR